MNRTVNHLKKIYKSAVSRNRVKRILRESFFRYLPQLDEKYWILIDLKNKTELKKSVLSQKTYQLISCAEKLSPAFQIPLDFPLDSDKSP